MTTKFEATKETITLHGLGFLQIKLGGNQRLHVWHPELPRRRCFEHSQIHDHRFAFVSRVLVGTQNNVVYADSKPDIGRPPTHLSYLHEGERTRFGNRPWIPDTLLCLSAFYREQIRSGDEYHMPPYVFHSTHPEGDGRVATLMTKREEGKIGAHSLCKIGIEPDVDFDRRQWPEDKLWSIVIDVLGFKP